VDSKKNIYIDKKRVHVILLSNMYTRVPEYNIYIDKKECMQGRSQDFKILGGGALKKFASSEGRRENFWGISCEKSRLYAKKSYLFQF
jgi:predicted nucleotide-binding protein (sugar kinase/HSP70/actin superfamily)